MAKSYFKNAIPHIRAMDFELHKPFALGEYLREHDLNTVLIVTGDMPQDMAHRVYKTTTLEMIRFFKHEYPEIKVYASIDPYRGSFRYEIDYVKQKVDAGADGFFTQPFFDMRLLEIYGDLLPMNDVYWGVSPVMTDGSRNYWETKNNAIFPKDFEPTMDWNAQFARDVLQFIRQRGGHVYFMPIRANVVDYLGRVFV
jgi:methylenetetrahydrofolate reductase (NADPH)